MLVPLGFWSVRSNERLSAAQPDVIRSRLEHGYGTECRGAAVENTVSVECRIQWNSALVGEAFLRFCIYRADIIDMYTQTQYVYVFLSI